LQQIDPSLTKESDAAVNVLEHLKALEHEGYQFENAEGSFDLLMQKLLGKFEPFFSLKQYNVNIYEPSADGLNSSVSIHLTVRGREAAATAQGDGPVNALDKAMRKALEPFYPAIRDIKLTDYKVRVLDSNLATAAKVRVLIESSDQQTSWATIGVSSDIIQASWLALKDALEYKLVQTVKPLVAA
jgi:2-isopropylmalate synthase